MNSSTWWWWREASLGELKTHKFCAVEYLKSGKNSRSAKNCKQSLYRVEMIADALNENCNHIFVKNFTSILPWESFSYFLCAISRWEDLFVFCLLKNTLWDVSWRDSLDKNYFLNVFLVSPPPSQPFITREFNVIIGTFAMFPCCNLPSRGVEL